MEKLNHYLQRLLSSCSEELRLEPNKNPFLVSGNSTTDVANAPLAGPQISTMVFPLIPPDVKSKLPNSSEIEFVHPHNLGSFTFTVQKSPAGFIVTVRPVVGDADGNIRVPDPLPPSPPAYESPEVTAPQFESSPQVIEHARPPEVVPTVDVPPSYEQISYELESSSSSYDLNTAEQVEVPSLEDMLVEPAIAPEYVPASMSPDVVDVNDPAFQTIFTETAPEVPMRRRSDFMPEYTDQTPARTPPPAATLPEITFEQPAYTPPPPAAAPVYTPPPAPVAAPPAEAAFVPAAANSAMAARMDALFKKMAELGASDLHMSVSMPPMMRKDGKMKPLQEGEQPLSAEAMRELLTSIMPVRNQEEFAQRSDTDFAYEIPGLARFRCNIFEDRKGMGAVFRIIPSKILTAEQLGLSKAIMDLCALSKGLVVVTGPTGSGKSTTLCAMVDAINKSREDHIITIEDPIEFVHENQKCLVNQREVHNHTDSFKDALRAALREDPDIVLVGEMRDLETISIAIETAETGHLVFGTLHTTTAASTVDRIIDQFPADRQQQIRVMLSESLKGVIAQTLLPKKGGGRVAALEVLIVTPAISNLIREGKTFQIPSAMQTGKNHGMVMLNDALFEHVKNGLVEPLDAYIKAVDKTGFESLLTRGGFKI
jgi:twitching motility protein PilT